MKLSKFLTFCLFLTEDDVSKYHHPLHSNHHRMTHSHRKQKTPNWKENEQPRTRVVMRDYYAGNDELKTEGEKSMMYYHNDHSNPSLILGMTREGMDHYTVEASSVLLRPEIHTNSYVEVE